MKRMTAIMLLLFWVPQLLALDVIETRNNQKYYGKVVGRKAKGFLIRTREGSVVVVPNSNIRNIKQGNKVYDFETGMKYHVETKRPYMITAVLGIGAGVYSVTQFQEYNKENKDKADSENMDGVTDTNQHTDVSKQPGKHLALGTVSALLSVASFYIAFRPMEVKVPLGKIKISAAPNRVGVALHF